MSIACCVESCGASVCFTPEVEDRLRRTHEWWMCPFGHRQHFAQESREEARTRYAEQARDRWRATAEELNGEFASCPFCDWRSGAGTLNRWRSMLQHFTKAHPDIIPPRALMAYYKAREAA